ncbi:hypothetical protein N658DRAFT_508569 [Parathielavia hyrcaniae]|uniref:FAD-binding PCMH-type domain-containing protein n=1 Tax=Parathielavia hyrcaniae TaxID=113614 RepID=A0AAN6PX16_9PEZI|nr:hypothetical protein N658DRAFT_508569 [Parathielavia hyrcaniae]
MPVFSTTRSGLPTRGPPGIDLSDRNRQTIYRHADRVVEKVGSRYILKTTSNTVNNSEAATHNFITRNTTVPVPKVYGEWLSSLRRKHNILEGRIWGFTLADCWKDLPLHARLNVAQEVAGHMRELARFTHTRMESVSGKRLPNNCFNPRPRDPRGYLSGRWSDDDDIFNNEFYIPLRRAGVSRATVAKIRRTMPPCRGELVLTHCDLFVGNVMVDPARGVVTGIIDWESGGYWPGWFQYARITQGCSDDDGEWKFLLSRMCRDDIRHAEHGRVWWHMVQTFLYEPDSAEAMVWLGLLLGHIDGRVSRATLHRYQNIGDRTKEMMTNQDMARFLNTLASALPGLVSFPNSSAYSIHNIYWSERQSEVHPSCFVAPNTAQDVAEAVKVVTCHNAPFTVKAGGHTPFEGGSNIDQGVTIALANLDAITVGPDRGTVSVGAGTRWINISEALDPLGLAVVGGRSATVGVSGLALGGGISYFSGTKGWACDNVRNYEVVLASGDIVNASPNENSDLYWALRGGGGSNFGIVTRFDLASFDQGDLWASSLIWPGALNRTLITLIHDLLVNGLPSDPEAHTYFVMTYYPQLGGYLAMNDQYHATHSDASSPPAVFAPFHDASLPTLLANTRVANVSRLSRDIELPFGLRQAYWDTSVTATATADLLLDIVPLWEEQVETLTAAAAAVNSTVETYLVYQGISSNILEAMQANGGNALGLRPEDGPVMIVQLSLTWGSAALDELVESTSRETIAKVNALAASRGAMSKNGYMYMNYADPSQDVYAGYGSENLTRLRRVSRAYDPAGKFRKLWRGYFKL